MFWSIRSTPPIDLLYSRMIVYCSMLTFFFAEWQNLLTHCIDSLPVYVDNPLTTLLSFRLMAVREDVCDNIKRTTFLSLHQLHIFQYWFSCILLVQSTLRQFSGVSWFFFAWRRFLETGVDISLGFICLFSALDKVISSEESRSSLTFEHNVFTETVAFANHCFLLNVLGLSLSSIAKSASDSPSPLYSGGK